MGHCLLYGLLLLSATAVPSLEAAADQGGRSMGAHELPAFVRERIELTPGTFEDREPPGDPWPKDRAAEDRRAG
jgi:hypothetical protein